MELRKYLDSTLSYLVGDPLPAVTMVEKLEIFEHEKHGIFSLKFI